MTDLREARRAYGAAVVEKLRDVPLLHKRVGIVGLRDYTGGSLGTRHAAATVIMERE